MAICSTCSDDVCVLIDNDCFHQYTGMHGFDLANLYEIIAAVNLKLNDVTGTCDLCEDFNTANHNFPTVVASVEFKRYYAVLIKYHWMKIYGNHKISKNGLVQRQADELSEWNHLRIRDKQKAEEDYFEMFVKPYEEAFSAYFFASTESDAQNCDSCNTSECTACSGVQTSCNCGQYLARYHSGMSSQGVVNNLDPYSYYDPNLRKWVTSHPLVEGFDEEFSII